LAFERLERRELPAIVWANQGSTANDTDDFKFHFGANNAGVARAIVRRAIADWNAVITNLRGRR
jgi:hypothetical protein